MASKTLRELAKQYAKGDLPKDVYRKERSALIESILSGETKLPVNDFKKQASPRKPAETQEVTERRSERKRPPQPPELDTTAIVRPGEYRSTTPRKQKRKPFPVLPAVLGAIVGVVAVAVVFVIIGGEDKEAPEAPSVAATPDQTQPVAPEPEPAPEPAGSPAATDLIRDFLRSKNWSDANMDQFVYEWENLPTEARQAADDSVALGQLTNAIYKKLLEERALSALGDEEEAVEKQRKLVAFAEQIGISDPRISLPYGAEGPATDGGENNDAGNGGAKTSGDGAFNSTWDPADRAQFVARHGG